MASSRDNGQNLVTLVCFAFGGLLTISSLAGFLDDRIVYCDARTNPCTEYTIPSHEAKKLKNIETLTTIPGNKNKLVLSMLGIPFFAVAWCISGDLKKRGYAQAILEQARRNSQKQEIQKREDFLAESRFSRLQDQVAQKMADLRVLENPELLERRRQEQAQPQEAALPPQPQQPPASQPDPYSTPQPYGNVQPSPPPVNSAEPQPQAVQPQQAKSVNPKFAKYYETGEMALKGMLYAQRSILLGSSSGTGKSTTEKEWIRRMRIYFPQVEFYALTQKAEDLCGLWNMGRMWLYDSNNVPECLEPIDIVYNIFTERRAIPGGEKIFRDKPVRLILGDWFATYNDLLKRHNNGKNKICGEYCSKIAQIITVGRAYNVAIFCDTQSVNMDSLGLAPDANIRKSLEIFAQGFKHPGGGQFGDGDYDVMRNAIQNKYICEPSHAGKLVGEIDQLAAAIARGEVLSPIIFMANIYPPALGLIPDLSHPEPAPVAQPPQQSVVDPNPASVSVVENKPTPEPRIIEEEEEDLEVVVPRNAAQLLSGIWNLERKYTPNNLSKEQLQKAIEQLEPIMGKDRAIATLWMIADPKSSEWSRAVLEYQEVKNGS